MEKITLNREKLIATAVALGLLFEKNISNANLQKKIDEKNAELEAQLKDTQNDDVEDTESDNTLNDEDTQNDDKQSNDDVTIQRVSSCGGYKTKIKGLKEAARRSGISVEQIQEALETGNPVGGYTFTFIG
jgi:hypothetical protein